MRFFIRRKKNSRGKKCHIQDYEGIFSVRIDLGSVNMGFDKFCDLCGRLKCLKASL